FGDSKVVDAEGGPLVVYHGTDSDVQVFNPSERGLFGAGIYMTTDITDAEQYTSERAPVELYASIQRPFCTKADYSVGEKIDFESPAVPMIREVFGDDAEAVLRSAMEGDGNLGSEVQDVLEAMGHDGIVVDWPDGLRHIIAFRPEQVKAVDNAGTF